MEEIFEAAREAAREIGKYRERYLEAWLAETGLLPSECVLMQQNLTDGRVKFWVEEKKKEKNNG